MMYESGRSAPVGAAVAPKRELPASSSRRDVDTGRAMDASGAPHLRPLSCEERRPMPTVTGGLGAGRSFILFALFRPATHTSRWDAELDAAAPARCAFDAQPAAQDLGALLHAHDAACLKRDRARQSFFYVEADAVILHH